jgi:hypothetical protein
VKVSISNTNSDIRLSNPTIQKTLESHKTTCKPQNNSTITLTARCLFCTPLPSYHVPAPRSNSKLVRQWTALKSRRSSSIPLNVPQIQNKASESHNKSTSEPLNPEMFLVVPFNNPTALDSHKTTCIPHNDTTITMTAQCFFCNPIPSDHAPAPRSNSKLARQLTALKSRRPSSCRVKHPCQCPTVGH